MSGNKKPNTYYGAGPSTRPQGGQGRGYTSQANRPQGGQGGGGQGGHGGHGGGSHGAQRLASFPGNGGVVVPQGQRLIESFETDRKPRTNEIHRQNGGPGINGYAAGLEQKYIQERSKVSAGLAQLQLEAIPYRPNYGTSGKKITVFANYFALAHKPGLIVHQYNIGTDEKLSKLKAKRREIIIKALQSVPNWASFRNRSASDFAQILLVSQLEPSDLMFPDTTVKVVDSEDEKKTWEVSFKKLKHFDMNGIMAQLGDVATGFNDHVEKYEIIQAMNVIFGKHASMSTNIFMKTNGQRNKMWHEETEKQDIGGGLQVLKGFVSSVRFATGRMLLNVNNAAVTSYKAGNLFKLMEEFSKQNSSVAELEFFLKKVKVQRTWLDNSKARTISGFAHTSDGSKDYPVEVAKNFAGPKQVKFKVNGKFITVYDHFRTNYPALTAKVSNLDTPVVNIGTPAKPAYVIAELCTVIAGQDYRGKLGTTAVTETLRFAGNQPWFNMKYIEQRAPPLFGPNIQNSGVRITNTQVITVSARILPEPIVNYGNKKFQVQDGGWNMESIKVSTAGRFPKKVKFIFFNSTVKQQWHFWCKDNNGKEVGEFFDEFKKLGIEKPSELTIEDVEVPLSGSQAQLDAGLRKMFESVNAGFLFLSLATKLPEWQYKRIKYFGDVVYGIPTVLVNFKAICKDDGWKKLGNRAQYLANVGLKLNLKLGGINQTPDPQLFPVITKDRVMFVGLDVTHPAPGAKDNAESVAAMVANIDGQLGQWPACLELNGRRHEEVKVVKKMLLSRLELWTKLGKNAQPPAYIMFFRDGVSEGQFERVRQLELQQIKEAIEVYYKNKTKPRIFMAVCGKRHNTRFAPTTKADCEKNGNCKAGTVVDSGITESRMWDFYLQAHRVIQGSGRTCHYTVLYDEIYSNNTSKQEFGVNKNVSVADALQSLCLTLASAYPRSSKSVSLATPAKLADLACDRARAYVSAYIDAGAADTASVASGSTAQGIQRDSIRVHDNLKDTMFYV